MNELQFALVKLAEEATELAKEALKAAEYGPDTYSKKYDSTAIAMMQDEYNDVLGCIEKVNSFGYNLHPDQVLISNRVKKIQKNMEAARSAGQLT